MQNIMLYINISIIVTIQKVNKFWFSLKYFLRTFFNIKTTTFIVIVISLHYFDTNVVCMTHSVFKERAKK